ncbi:Hypothetical predicted protein [Prunus dulcis]|uniref:Uncharacterized protein n=1 Tax=Prunus dulcis TaxID=3755 RepID=A0A5E4FA65_PRUDU|nr:Hypothetical predicted protein [Prunus dulcis]
MIKLITIPVNDNPYKNNRVEPIALAVKTLPALREDSVGDGNGSGRGRGRGLDGNLPLRGFLPSLMLTGSGLGASVSQCELNPGPAGNDWGCCRGCDFDVSVTIALLMSNIPEDAPHPNKETG